MRLGIRKTFKILAPGNSLRKRVAYSLAIARFILVPVIFLAVYYLFELSGVSSEWAAYGGYLTRFWNSF